MVLNRRKFFKWLGVGTAAVAVAPSAIEFLESACVAPASACVAPAPAVTAYSTYIMGQDAIIGSYFDYSNFSDLAIASAINAQVESAGKELSYRAGLHVGN